MSDKYIAVIDSGMGGLTVVDALRKMYPEENILFFADTKNLPYGDKTKQEIIALSSKTIEYLNKQLVQAIVIACNTIDSNAGKILQENSKIPLYRIIDPTSLQAAKITKNKKIAVLATSAAINSNAYKNTLLSIDKDLTIYQIACPKLVPLIESGHFDKDDKLIQDAVKEYLLPLLEKDIDTLILGCTHYPLLTDIFKQLAPNINLVSSSLQAAKAYYDDNNDNHNKEGKTICYVSKDSISFKQRADRFLKQDLNVKEITID